VKILGLWDGHDAGAALIVNGTIAAAVNEERLTRRKLEVRFPIDAIRTCCQLAGVRADEVDVVATCTSDVAKTLARAFPGTKEAYYQIRRRKAAAGRLTALRKRAKYLITEWPPNTATRALSAMLLRRAGRDAGLTTTRLHVYDHHACHAIAAAAASGFDDCAVLTIDGVGDGLSATVSTFTDGRIERIAETSARDSPGVFFEHVTNLLNMRELEDEGKVMALADYASPVPDADNPLLKLITVRDLRFATAAPGHTLMSTLRDVLWRYPNEQFAAMAQRAVEDACVRMARDVVQRTGRHKLALAGGVASNVKVNRRIRLLPDVSEVFVFPHMGDGGLALGAALLAAREHGDRVEIRSEDIAWGPSYTDADIGSLLHREGAGHRRCADIASTVADLLQRGDVVLWFQGRMEYGPRALGHRSVLARPDCPALRDRLNLVLKRRVWYQPFCPSILESDARTVLSDWKGAPNRHMTMAYTVGERYRPRLAGVISIDGSCRPQIVRDDADGPFAALLREVRLRTGLGAILNTSLNIHGEPLVCTPEEAVAVFRESGADALAIGSFLVERHPTESSSESVVETPARA
jgi:carbamoyltransferase